MELGDALREKVLELEKRFPGIRARLAEIAEGATIRAVETATELTPPNTFEDGEARGVNMITGATAQHIASDSGGSGDDPQMWKRWKKDSKTRPTETASRFVTVLANDMEYASCVNDGHRVKKRFVPGLYIDPESGLLSYNLNEKGKKIRNDVPPGLMVGTKTTYVEGLHMKDKAKEVYEEIVEQELDKLTKEVLEP